MKKISRALIILLVLIFLCQTSSYARGPLSKLGRGLANTATGWIEIFTTVDRTVQEHGYMGGGIAGFPLGVVKALLRTGAGLYEVLTFPSPIPEGYESIVEPEFVLKTHAERARPINDGWLADY